MNSVCEETRYKVLAFARTWCFNAFRDPGYMHMCAIWRSRFIDLKDACKARTNPYSSLHTKRCVT